MAASVESQESIPVGSFGSSIGQRSISISLVTETWAPEVNGVALTVGYLARALRGLGHSVQVVRPRQAADDAGGADADGLVHHTVAGFAVPFYRGVRIGLPAGRRLRQLWSRHRPDVVHVVTEGPLGASGLAVAERMGIPATSDYRTHFDAYSNHYGLGWLRPLVEYWLKRLHRRTLVTFAPTLSVAEALRQKGYGEVAVVGRGVDSELFSPRRRSAALRASWGIGPADHVALFVSRVAPEKNLPLLFEAFSRFRAATRGNARLVVVGEGPAREECQRRYPEHHFAGQKVGVELAEHYGSADVFLFPSLTETYGNVIPEALSSGLAVLAFNCAAAADLIDTGRNGLLAPVGQPEQFVRYAEQLGADTGLVGRIRQAAPEAVRQLNWKAIATDFTEKLRVSARRKHKSV